MAITYKAGNRLIGLSSDTKPTADGSLVNNSTFMETDTGKEYKLQYGSWNEVNKPADSIGELLNDYSTPSKQHFWDWFSAASIDSSFWTSTNVTGSGTFAMVDAVDGGFGITTGTGANRESNISFNNKRQYSHTGCVSIWIAKATATSGSDVHLGFSNDATSASYVASDHQANWEIDSGTQYLLTSDGSSASRTALSSTTAMGTGWRIGKVECGSANIKLTIEGVLEVTKTTNRPGAALQPKFSVYGNGKTGYVRYMECYNT